MSSRTAVERPDTAATVPAIGSGGHTGRRPASRWVWRVVALAVVMALPFYLDEFWLQLGLLVFAAMIGALGLNLLVGQAGQVSLAHPLFVAVGAYGYTVLASHGERSLAGLGLPPLLAMAGAVAAAGGAGLLFTPIAARLSGIYLAVASLGPVFLAQHLLLNLTTLTGGYNGRDVPTFMLAGLSFDDAHPWSVLGVPFGRVEKLWYVAMLAMLAGFAFYTNLGRSRAGRALAAIRGGEIPAAAMGVNVTRYKAAVFVTAAIYAGMGGVLLALALQRLVPDAYDAAMAFTYLAMIVIGGLGSPAGALLGAALVTSLPVVLSHEGDAIPFLAVEGSGGVTAGVAAQLLFGASMVTVLLFKPTGLAGLARRLGVRTR